VRKTITNVYPGLRAKMSFYNHDVPEIAKILGMSNDSVRRRLKGNVEFELTEIKKLMKTYRCGFDDLFDTNLHYKN
jgi:hypothetical protein